MWRWFRKFWWDDPPYEATSTPGIPYPEISDYQALVNQRHEEVRKLLEELFPGEPFVYQGRFNWFRAHKDDVPGLISFCFLDLDIVIQVYGPEIPEPQPDAEGYIRYLGSDTHQTSARLLNDICRAQNILLFEIFWSAALTKERLQDLFEEAGVEFSQNIVTLPTVSP